MDDLATQMKTANLTKLGFRHPLDFIGKLFLFSGDIYGDRHEIVGQITGVFGSECGLPKLEISNRRFAGLEIESIMVLSKAEETFAFEAMLITTAESDQLATNGIIFIKPV